MSERFEKAGRDGTDGFRSPGRPPTRGVASGRNRPSASRRGPPPNASSPSRPLFTVRRWLARRSLLRNSGYIMLTTGINSALGYVFWIVATRSYPTAAIGVGAALITAMTFVAAVANFGTSPALIQRLPRARDDDDWSQIVSTSVITGAVAGLVIALVCALVILPSASRSLAVAGKSVWYALLFAAGVAVWSLSLIADYLFIAERRSENMTLRNLAFGLFKLVLVVLVVLAGARSALSIFLCWVGGCLLSLALARTLLLRRVPRRFHLAIRGTLTSLRSMGSSYFGNYLTTLGNVIPFALLPTLVVARLSATDNAYFYVTWLLGGAFFMISSAVGSALFAEGSNDPDRVDDQTRSAIKITAALLAPMMLVFFIGGRWLLGVFGAQYASHGATLLIVLTASAVPDAVTNIYVARLRARQRLAFPAAMNMAMAAVTLLGAWLLLPPLGIVGAGVAWIAAQSTGTVAVLADVALKSRRPRRSGEAAPVEAATTPPSTATNGRIVEGAGGAVPGVRSPR